MSRRPSDIATLCCAVSPRERALVDDLKAMLGITSDGDVIRVALWQYLHWQQLPVDTAVFQERRSKRSAGRRNAQAWTNSPYMTGQRRPA